VPLFHFLLYSFFKPFYIFLSLCCLYFFIYLFVSLFHFLLYSFFKPFYIFLSLCCLYFFIYLFVPLLHFLLYSFFKPYIFLSLCCLYFFICLFCAFVSFPTLLILEALLHFPFSLLSLSLHLSFLCLCYISYFTHS
jgi:hypothetical protein